MLFSQSLVDSFQDKKEFIEVFSMYGHRDREFGVKRWDGLIKYYPYSGVVVLPVRIKYFDFINPFYFVFEKIGNQEMVFIKSMDDNLQPFRLGDVYGFFGFKGFKGFNIGDPIFIVESLSDWWVVRKYLYKYVLVSFTAGLSWKQVYFLSHITSKLFVGFDNDKAGNKAVDRVKERFRKINSNVSIEKVTLVKKDWGSFIEDEDYSLLKKMAKNFNNKYIIKE